MRGFGRLEACRTHRLEACVTPLHSATNCIVTANRLLTSEKIKQSIQVWTLSWDRRRHGLPSLWLRA